jgi:hypothetical protein
MKSHLLSPLLAVIALAQAVPNSLCDAAEPITTKQLVGELTNLAGMAEFPSPAYTCKQFSSYDRAAKSPAENWFANGDCGQYLRVEERAGRKEYVMMDTAGPGAIVRIWSANPAGTLRIYLDGSEVPVLESPMPEILGGKYPGLPRPIAGERSRGWNLYFPIPYAKHCKVTSDAGNFSYHVNYRTYQPGTAVESFRSAQIEELAAEITAVAIGLTSPWAETPEGIPHKLFQSELAAGGSSVLASLTGPMAITEFNIQWPPSADRDEPTLRSTVVEMTFDGETTVSAPLGDFFGTAPGLSDYSSLPSSVAKSGKLECRWVMPFAKSAQIRVRNLGKAPVKFSGSLVAVPRPWTDQSMHFHAKWRASFDVPTEPKIDWNYLTTRGRGVFAGVSFSIDNPVKDWWGEGDEKIYVDGEAFPSHFGTGTEDYYGYAWCSPALFTHAYHNQPRCDGPGNYGRTSVNRWHIIDRIPFTKDFRFDMELWHWKKCQTNLSVVAYWYAQPGGTDTFKPLTADELVLRPIPELQVFKVKGAIEGESMKVLHMKGAVKTQEWDGDSHGAHLWWSGGQQPGDTLELGFTVKSAGRYQLNAQLLKAVDYGIAQVQINGAKLGDPIDFYHEPGVVVGPPIALGVVDLKAGENSLSFTITGAHPKAKKSYMIGLDYLLLTPEK